MYELKKDKSWWMKVKEIIKGIRNGGKEIMKLIRNFHLTKVKQNFFLLRAGAEQYFKKEKFIINIGLV